MTALKPSVTLNFKINKSSVRPRSTRQTLNVLQDMLSILTIRLKLSAAFIRSFYTLVGFSSFTPFTYLSLNYIDINKTMAELNEHYYGIKEDDVKWVIK